MKKLLLINFVDSLHRYILCGVLPFLYAFTLQAGNFTVDYADSVTVGRPGLTMSFAGFVNNSLSSSNNYRLTKVSENLPAGWGISFCTPSGCYPVGATSNTFSVAGNGSGYVLIEFHTTNILATGTTTIRFENVSNPSDVVELQFTAHTYSFLPGWVTTSENGTTNQTTTFTADLWNNIATDLDIKMEILSYTGPSDWTFEICNPNGCVDQTVGSANFTIPAATQFVFVSGKITAGNTAGIGTMTVRLTNVNIPSEVVDQTLTLDATGGTAIDPVMIPDSKLGQNFPNPFTQSTTIPFNLNRGESGLLVIRDMNGKTLEVKEAAGGTESIEWTPRYSEGIYFYTLFVDGLAGPTRKMQISK